MPEEVERMELSEYQREARLTDRVAIPDDNAIIVPLLGLAGEAGSLLVEFKKQLRDGSAHTEFEPRMSEELGDVLWYVANLATKFGLSLDDIAEGNLAKTRDRWTIPSDTGPLYDAQFPSEEQFPRRMTVEIVEVEEDSSVRVSLFVDGEQVGNELTDNAHADDGYRYHDVLHLANVACLGWSPTLRGLMHLKRRSDPSIDEVEDGGRAIVIDEGLVAFVFEYARRHQFLEGVQRLDYGLLRAIRVLTSGLEVSSKSTSEWEYAILQGFDAWRHIRDNRGGRLLVDLEVRELRVDR